MKRLGATLLLMGVFSFILPLIGLQFQLLNLFGSQRAAGLLFIVVGGILLAIAAARERKPVPAAKVPPTRQSAQPPPLPTAQAASRSGSPPPNVRQPPSCPKCGSPFDPGETFCGECGEPLAPPVQSSTRPSAPSVQTPPPLPPAISPTRATKSSPVAKILAAVVLLVAAVGAASWYYLGRGSTSPANRQAPAIPKRMAGLLSEFPVDTDSVNPARPVSVVQGGEFAMGSVPVPAAWLPPGFTPANLAEHADGLVSALYRADVGQPAVNVHIMQPTDSPQSVSAGLANTVAAASRAAETTGVRVRSPDGRIYQGFRISSPQGLVFVLGSTSVPSVVIVNTPDVAARPLAERLAANVGNGQGLMDYPEFREPVSGLPAQLPAGMELESLSSFSPEDLGLSVQQLINEGGSGMSKGSQQYLSSQMHRLIPQRLTSAVYRDASGQDWTVLAGDYRSVFKAAAVWQLVRGLGLTEMDAVASGGGKLWIEDASGRLIVYRSGSAVVLLHTPKSVALYTAVSFLKSLQF